MSVLPGVAPAGHGHGGVGEDVAAPQPRLVCVVLPQLSTLVHVVLLGALLHHALAGGRGGAGREGRLQVRVLLVVDAGAECVAPLQGPVHFWGSKAR